MMNIEEMGWGDVDGALPPPAPAASIQPAGGDTIQLISIGGVNGLNTGLQILSS